MHIGKHKTDAQLILGLMAAFPGVSEKIAKTELKQVYERFAEINSDNWADQKVKFLEMGFAALEKMDATMQYGPYANMFKTLAGISGIVTEKAQVDQTVSQGTPAPKADIVRDRIERLSKDPKIRERAIKLGLDIDDLDKKAK